jgi:hypothetical protein
MVTHRSRPQRPFWIHAITLTVLVSGTTGNAALKVQAAELAEQARSLRAVPADAAFYSASLRLKEQMDIFLASKAYQRLMQIPIVQLGKMQLTFQWQQAAVPQVAQFRQYVDSPEGQDAIALLKDMFSEELFMYGSSDVAATLRLFMDLNSISRRARIDAISGEEPAEDVVAQRTMDALRESVKTLQVPTVVFGWRITDGERAERQLDAVHTLVRNLLDEHRPELSAHLQRDQIRGHEFLTLRLDGSMIPWDQIREQTEDEEEVQKWQELMSDKTMALALGVTDEFALFSLGESTDHLETFGQGESLAEQPAIERLNKHAEQRIASVGYMSKELAQTLSSPERTIEDLAGMAEDALRAAEVSEEERQQLLTDIRGLGNEMKKYVPAPSEVSGVTYLTSRGMEGFRYQSGVQPMWDSSKAITLLEHVGGNPLAFVATRAQENPEDYSEAVEWVKRIGAQVETIVKSKVEPDQWAQYQQYRDRGVALLERLDRANREHFIPALADGQSALVVDTAIQSKQWVRQMPESPKPLPMLELAIVCSVSDAEHLRQGIGEVVDVVEEAISLAREVNPEQIPDFEIPEPDRRELEGGGTLYVYSLPDEWGLDPKVAPNAGLTDTAVVLSWSPESTERLLEDKDLDVDTSLDLDRPAAVISHFQVAKLVESVRPWIDYGFDVATGKLKVNDEEGDDESADEEADAQRAAMAMQMGFIMPQIQQFLEVSTAMKSFSSVTYEEDGLWITHSETHFEDLK